MIVRAMLGLSLANVLMGFSQSAPQFLIFRETNRRRWKKGTVPFFFPKIDHLTNVRLWPGATSHSITSERVRRTSRQP